MKRFFDFSIFRTFSEGEPRFKIFGRQLQYDEGLKLETSVFESFTVANLPYGPCG